MNAYTFNLRTRTLNSLLNSLIQFPTTALLNWFLDHQRFGSRKKRLMIGTTFTAIWVSGAYIAQTSWMTAWDFDRSIPGPKIDCADPAYAGVVVIYLFYAGQDGIFGSVILYTLATFTNDPRKNAGMGGLYVGSEYLIVFS
jgi:hypothetical protein